jgi:hypothetical protein
MDHVSGASSPDLMETYLVHILASTKKLGYCLRRRVAIEVDTAITAALTRLWEKETERSAIAIRKETDKREDRNRHSEGN